jgi:hypothetical protein
MKGFMLVGLALLLVGEGAWHGIARKDRMRAVRSHEDRGTH